MCAIQWFLAIWDNFRPSPRYQFPLTYLIFFRGKSTKNSFKNFWLRQICTRGFPNPYTTDVFASTKNPKFSSVSQKKTKLVENTRKNCLLLSTSRKNWWKKNSNNYQVEEILANSDRGIKKTYHKKNVTCQQFCERKFSLKKKLD